MARWRVETVGEADAQAATEVGAARGDLARRAEESVPGASAASTAEESALGFCVRHVSSRDRCLNF